MNSLDQAISDHIDQRSARSLERLYTAFLGGKLFVVLEGEPAREPSGELRVRTVCIQDDAGQSCLPTFTSLDHLLEWRADKPPSIEMPGLSLFHLASTMPISRILVNHGGIPRGEFTRPEIEELAAGRTPKNGGR